MRSFFGAIEDWNPRSVNAPVVWLIAIVLRGDRGLEQALDQGVKLTVYCDRSSGRSRIGTCRCHWSSSQKNCDRSSGRSRIGTKVTYPAIWISGHCDRSSGRSRIGTAVRTIDRPKVNDCDRSSGRSRIGTWAWKLSQQDSLHIAIVLRDDRGLELFSVSASAVTAFRNCDRSSGRSRIGTSFFRVSQAGYIELRSFFGTIEDWNYFSDSHKRRTRFIAIVLRDDRGLELYLPNSHRQTR